MGSKGRYTENTIHAPKRGVSVKERLGKICILIGACLTGSSD